MQDIETIARAALAEAAQRLRTAWRGNKQIELKGPVDLVTATDREIEAVIVGSLRDAFPDHAILAEEGAAAGTLTRPLPNRYTWFLDPLDGTVNFAHSLPHFAVSLALAWGSELRFGIVHDPLRDETFVAHRGDGATLNGRPIQVSTAAEIDSALLATGFPYDRRTHVDFYLAFVGDMLRRARDIRRAGSAALDLCYVACGRLDGFWEWKLKPWDTAAGALIVREAGGVVSDFRGGPFDPFDEQTLASNGHVHRQMVDILSARLAGARGGPPADLPGRH